MTYAQGFSWGGLVGWGRQRTAAAVVALFVTLTALMAAPPPPDTGTARATGRLVRVIVRQLSHASDGPARAIRQWGGEVGRPLVHAVTPDSPLHTAR